MSSALEQDILVKTNGEEKPIEVLNKEAQQYFLGLSAEEVETESKELLSSNTNFSFELENGHFANIYINKR